MRNIYINSYLNPLTKFTGSSRGTEFKDILSLNISQMIAKTVPISTRIVISSVVKQVYCDYTKYEKLHTDLSLENAITFVMMMWMKWNTEILIFMVVSIPKAENSQKTRKVSDSAVFSIWKSLWVLQKTCIMIAASAIYTDLFFFTYASATK